MRKISALIVFIFMSFIFCSGSVFAEAGDDWDWPPLEETYTVGGFVWNDLNRNGLQDPGEPGIAGISVSLVTEDNKYGGTGVSDSQGRYRIEKLYKDTYYVYFGDPNRDYTHTAAHVSGQNTQNDSDCGVQVILSGDDFHVDVGLLRLCVLSGEVYEDLNRNGQRDEGEPPLPAEIKLDWGANIAITEKTSREKSDFRFKTEGLASKLSVTPLDIKYRTLSGGYEYVTDIDFSDGDIIGLRFGFAEKTPEPAESPEPTGTPEPAESPEPSEPPEPTEIPEPSVCPKPSEKPKHSENPAAYRASGTSEARKAADNEDIKVLRSNHESRMRIRISGAGSFILNEKGEKRPLDIELPPESLGGRALIDALLPKTETDFKGWIYIGENHYYCAGNREILQGGFKLINGDYYYFTPSGEALFMLTR